MLGGVGTGDGGFWCIARWGGEWRGGEGRGGEGRGAEMVGVGAMR